MAAVFRGVNANMVHLVLNRNRRHKARDEGQMIWDRKLFSFVDFIFFKELF